MKEIKLYSRIGLVVLVVTAVLMVLIKNHRHEVSVWFFWLTDETRKINVLWLMLYTAAGTMITWWTLRLGWRLRRDWREHQQRLAIQRNTAEQQQKERDLAEREKRLQARESSAETESDQDKPTT